MTMNKWLYTLIAAFFLSVFGAFSSQAQIKFDVSRGANKTMETASGYAEEAQKLMEESTFIQTVVAYGKGAMEVAKMLKENIDEVKGMIDDAKGTVNSLKETATSAVSDLNQEVGNLQGDLTGAVGSATGGLSETASAAAEKTRMAKELASLKNEKSSIESEYNTAAAARKTELEGQIKSYQENNDAYQKMIAEDPSQKEELETKIAANNQAINSLREQYEAQEAEEKEAMSVRLAEVDAKIQSLRDQVTEQSLSLANEGVTSMAKSLFGGNNQSAAELNQTIANNFIPEDEPETAASIGRVRKYRNKVMANDISAAMSTAMNIRASRGQNNEKADDLFEKVPAMDGSTAAVAMDTQIKVENMKAILLYTKLMLAEMKMRTAMDLAKLNVYKLRNPGKDVTQFNLDDYKYKKPSKINKESISKAVTKGKSVFGDIKDSGVLGMLH